MTPERITCLCPNCRASYRVPASAAGHHAKCRTCGKAFRVTERASRPPTEDDILRWLREAEEKDDVAAEQWQDAADELPAGSSGEFNATAAPQQNAAPAPPSPDARAIREATRHEPRAKVG